MAEQRTVAIRIAVENVQQAVSLLKSFGSEGEAAFEQVARKATDASGNLDRAVRGMGDSVSGARQAFGQLGYQVQDFVVQVQSGTSPVTAFIQQGSQIAGAFGPVPALLAAAGGAVLGAASALLDFNTEVEKTPDRLGALLDGFDQAGTRAQAAAEKIRNLNEANRQFIAAQAEAQSQAIKKEVGPSVDEIVAGLDDTLRQAEYKRLATLPPGEANRQLQKSLSGLADKTGDAQARLTAAAKGGKPDEVRAIAVELGIAGTPEIVELADIAARNAATLATKDAAIGGSATGIPPVQDFGKALFDVSAQTAILPTSADLKRQIAAADKTSNPFAVALKERAQADKQAAADYQRERQSLLDQVTRSAERTEKPDETVARLNRELATLKARLDALRRPGQDNAEVDQAVAVAEETARREIAAIRQRQADEIEQLAKEQERKEEAVRREAERARQAYERDFRDAETEALQAARGVEEDNRKSYLAAFAEAEREATATADQMHMDQISSAQTQSGLMADVLATPGGQIAPALLPQVTTLFLEFSA